MAENGTPCSDAQGQKHPLDPRGLIHIPIGIPNTVDTLKTFVEAEGCFSPGFATYGIYFWLYDRDAKTLTAPTMPHVECERGLYGHGNLVPWTSWSAGDIGVRTEVCEMPCESHEGDAYVVAARVHLVNRGSEARHISLYGALRPLGPAGGEVKRIEISDRSDALLVDGHTALLSEEQPAKAGVLPTDTVGEHAMRGEVPVGVKASSENGDCSGTLCLELDIEAGESARTLGFVCPVLPGRRAVGHRWDGTNQWAQLDLARPNPEEGGALQPDPGLAYYRNLCVSGLFEAAEYYWADSACQAAVKAPGGRWGECFAAIAGHAAMAMNDGAPDVAVVNYNVFNRDGVYVANILQKAGQFQLASQAIDYFLGHPFNGRVQCEADNPGQILWIMGQHWLFTRDKKWLKRVYPPAAKIAAMIRHYRTTPPPHYVKATSLEFGDALPPDKPDLPPGHRRQALQPGSCDGHHPEYTEAFDIAGLRAAALLAETMGKNDDAAAWKALANSLFEAYDKRFGGRLPREYGSFSVLWPCRLYPLESGKAFEQFRDTGGQKSTSWRYFPLAAAHQGLLAGNRAAGHETIQAYLDEEQMRGWYALDEGGRSGSGGWHFARTTWQSHVAMPHGWAVAEMFLLLRDSLVFEDGDRLVLLAGVPEEWFTARSHWSFGRLPTHFGACSLRYMPVRGGVVARIAGEAEPPQGYALRVPRRLSARFEAGGKVAERAENGDVLLPRGTNTVTIHWTKAPVS